MKKLILRNFQSPGDIVMLTAALRDLHRTCRGMFLTDVRTSCPELWENNPYVTRLEEDDPEVSIIDCEYPLIHQSNRAPYHFIHGFHHFLNDRLRVNAKLTEFKGDIHLSAEEKCEKSPVEALLGEPVPYWLITSGGKFDFTIKWWDAERFQEVVDRLAEKILFVQVGASTDHHPPLNAAIDLRGKTSLRDLVRLVYHADGVLSPVTLLMHLAAAVERRHPKRGLRPCVVVAGGREPAHWEAYPGHQYLHTVGALPCCANGGCWRSRTVPLGDGEANDSPEALCVDVILYRFSEREEIGDAWTPQTAASVHNPRYLPHCMDMITTNDVVRAIERYAEGSSVRYLEPRFARLAGAIRNSHVAFTTPAERQSDATISFAPDSIELRREALRRCVEREYHYPPKKFSGRGIVICGGGSKYFPSAWVCIRILRHLGCKLPIELWHLGPDEMTDRMRAIVTPFGVACVDAYAVRLFHPVRRLGGWELKAYAIMHSAFEEVLLLDADNVPVRNPEFLFESEPFRRLGAIFWPDIWRMDRNRLIWSICDIPFRDEWEFESGQIVLNKRVCWKALQLTMHFNEYSDFYYRHVLGDKETFHLAWMKLSQPYAIPERPAATRFGTLMQHNFDGSLLFQHRNGDKWRLRPRNAPIPGFLLEADCFRFLDDLEDLWQTPNTTVSRWNAFGRSEEAVRFSEQLQSTNFRFRTADETGCDFQFGVNGRVIKGASASVQFWNIVEEDGTFSLEISSDRSLTATLHLGPDAVWRSIADSRELTYEIVPQPKAVGQPPINRFARLRTNIEIGVGVPPDHNNGFTVLARRIPKTIHIVGLDGNGSASRNPIDSWRSKHPTWEMKPWSEADCARLIGSNTSMQKVRASALRESLAALEILRRHGGVVANARVLPLKSLEPLIATVASDVFAAFISPSERFQNSIGVDVIGAVPEAAFIKAALSEIIILETGTECSLARWQRPIPYSLPDLLTRLAVDNESITMLPRHVFYPEAGEEQIAFTKLVKGAQV